jgi:hypothetical protein
LVVEVAVDMVVIVVVVDEEGVILAVVMCDNISEVMIIHVDVVVVVDMVVADMGEVEISMVGHGDCHLVANQPLT